MAVTFYLMHTTIAHFRWMHNPFSFLNGWDWPMRLSMCIHMFSVNGASGNGGIGKLERKAEAESGRLKRKAERVGIPICACAWSVVGFTSKRQTFSVVGIPGGNKTHLNCSGMQPSM